MFHLVRNAFLFFCAHFWHFQKSPVLCRARGIKRNSSTLFGSFQIFCGVGNEKKMKKFPQISVIFAFCGFVGSRGKNIAVTLSKSPLAALKVLREAHTEETKNGRT